MSEHLSNELEIPLLTCICKTTRTEVNINTVATVIQENRPVSVRLLEQQCNILKLTIHRILTEHLGMRRIASTLVLHFSSTKQMQQHVEACRENLALIVENPSILSKIIMVDESWIHYFDRNTKCEREAWKRPEEPRPKKVRQ